VARGASSRRPPIRTDRAITTRVTAPVGVTARQLVDESWAASTLDAYEGAWARFAAWCHAIRHLDDPLDADEDDLAEYVAYHVRSGLTPAYLARNLAGITHAYELTGRTSPTRHPLVRRAVAGARRHQGTARRQAAPLRLDELRRIVTAMAIVTNRPPNDPVLRRDRALLLTGWAAARRAGELVALDVDDLTFTGDPDRGVGGGVLIRIRRSKTDQEQHGTNVAIPYSAHIGSCPVRHLMLIACERRTGPLFRSIDRHGRVGGRLSADAVSRIVRRHVSAVLGVDPGLYSGHSLRAGFVTEMRTQGVPAHLIMRQTGHTDPRMLTTYDRTADLFNQPALAGDGSVRFFV
jgi:integrase